MHTSDFPEVWEYVDNRCQVSKDPGAALKGPHKGRHRLLRSHQGLGWPSPHEAHSLGFLHVLLKAVQCVCG